MKGRKTDERGIRKPPIHKGKQVMVRVQVSISSRGRLALGRGGGRTGQKRIFLHQEDAGARC